VCNGSECEIKETKLQYDHLIISVGAATNTYGVPGVKENCIFLKQIADAAKIRAAIGNAFEVIGVVILLVKVAVVAAAAEAAASHLSFACLLLSF